MKVDLTQEEIDALVAIHEEDVISKKAVADALKKLPDSVGGRGKIPRGVKFNCVRCGRNIKYPEDLGHKYGKFVHISCVEENGLNSETEEV